jgi:hypothetical protein
MSSSLLKQTKKKGNKQNLIKKTHQKQDKRSTLVVRFEAMPSLLLIDE